MPETTTPPKSQRILRSSKSIIRELLKLANKPDIISFAGGLPAAASFPIERIRQATEWVLANDGAHALQYSTTEGELYLRKELAKFESAKGVPTSADDIQIVTGSQQALSLIGLAYIDEGTLVGVESPTYLGALQAFSICSPKYIEVPVDEGGLNPDLIGPEFKDIRFLYVIPTFQNPTGTTMSEERRIKLAQKAREYDFWIIEDNPYGDLWYEQEPPKPLRYYAPERTLSLGTFSKILSPGFRLGYVIGPKPALDPLTTLKQSVDLHTSTFNQLISARALEENLMTEHMPDVRKLYKDQCQVMLDAMEEYMPEGVKWAKPAGGMFIWVELPEGLNTAGMMKEAIDRGVVFVPGSAFYANEAKNNTLRLSFVTVPKDKIIRGIQLLATFLKEKIDALN